MDVTPPPNDPLGAALEQAKPTPDPDRAQALEDALVARLYELNHQNRRKSNMQTTLTYPRPTVRAWSGFITTAVTVAAFALLAAVFATRTPPPNGDDGRYVAPANVDLSQREGSPTPTPFPPTIIPVEGQPTVPPSDMTATPIPFEGTAFPPTVPCPLEGTAFPQTIPWPQTITCPPEGQRTFPQSAPWPELFGVTSVPFGDRGRLYTSPDGTSFIVMATPLPFSTQEAARPVITFAASRLVTLDLSAPLDISQLSAGQTVVLYLPVLTSIGEINRDSVERVPVGVGQVTHRNPGTDSIVILMTAPMLVEQSHWAVPDSRALIAVEVVE